MNYSESNIEEHSGESREEIERIINRISVAGVKEKAESMRDRTLEKINRRIDVSGRRSLLVKISSVAASVIFLLGITGYFAYQWGYMQQNSQWVELTDPLGTKSSVTLSDGTKVTMNAGTTLKYPVTFTSATREVEVSGEAFFDVTHDNSHPFIVKAGPINVKVFGTTFNVKAYRDDNNIAVTLEHGSVGVESGNLPEPVRLTSGQQVVFNKTNNRIFKHRVSVEHYLAWKEGKYYFRNTSFDEIAKQLERSFNVRIFIDSDKLKRTNFTGDFVRGENIEQIIRIMTIDKRINCEIDGSQIYISEQK